MPTINVNLTSEMAEFVARDLAGGDRVSASDLVRDARRSLRWDRENEGLRIEALRRKLDIGLAQAERGEFWSRSVVEIAAAAFAEDR